MYTRPKMLQYHIIIIIIVVVVGGGGGGGGVATITIIISIATITSITISYIISTLKIYSSPKMHPYHLVRDFSSLHGNLTDKVGGVCVYARGRARDRASVCSSNQDPCRQRRSRARDMECGHRADRQEDHIQGRQTGRSYSDTCAYT
jgi:hypothetical protein